MSNIIFPDIIFRFNYFFNKNKLDERSKKLINSAHEKYPGNLLIRLI